MKLGVFTVSMEDKSLDEMLCTLKEFGVETVEIGTGGYPGTAHADVDALISDKYKLEEFLYIINSYGMGISAFSCHGNPVHPNKGKAQIFQEDFRKTVILAQMSGVDTINTFSGCPGGSQKDTTPNWVTCTWPEEFSNVLDYQWDQVLIPYWEQATAFAAQHGIRKIGLEMHPGFSVYNTATLLKLRKAVGDSIGVNFDPSNIYWQGMDPVTSICELGDAIFHVHAKDCKIYEQNRNANGVLDTVYADYKELKSWGFVGPGEGHGCREWKSILGTLKIVGYDGAISIEHEDHDKPSVESLKQSVEFLKPIIAEINVNP